MEAEFYEIIIKGNHRSGVLYESPRCPEVRIDDAAEIQNWKDFEFELRDGCYCPYNMGPGCSRIVTKEFKDLLLTFVPPHFEMEFLPVKVLSKEYGDKECYILHFTKIFDVMDKEHTIYSGNVILKIRLDYEKTKSLNMFNTQPFINDFIVSRTVRDAIKKEKLDFGIEFCPIFYGE